MKVLSTNRNHRSVKKTFAFASIPPPGLELKSAAESCKPTRPACGNAPQRLHGNHLFLHFEHTPHDEHARELHAASKYQKGEGVKVDVVLSEEGGRFYHEQNRNVIIYIDEDELPEVPDGYIWTDYAALGYMVQINNCLNIQLRNLMSLIDL